jgi:hypothetical protein
MNGKLDRWCCSILNDRLMKSMKFGILKIGSCEYVSYSGCSVVLLKHIQWNLMAAKDDINTWTLFTALRSTNCNQHTVLD